METQILNAEQARELMNAKKKDLNSILETIRAMANSGNNYATIETRVIADPKERQRELQGMGYNVEISENYFSIKW